MATIFTSSDYTVGTPGSATVNTADDGDQWLDMFTTGDPLEVFEGVGSQVVTPVFSFRTVEASTFRAAPPDPIAFSIVSREGPGSMQATVTDDYLAPLAPSCGRTQRVDLCPDKSGRLLGMVTRPER